MRDQLEALENVILQRIDLLDLDEDIVVGLPYEVDADGMWPSAESVLFPAATRDAVALKQ